MGRRNILEVAEDITKFLKKEGEASINKICYETKTQREVCIKALNHLKKFNIVKERKESRGKIKVRLFSLEKTYKTKK